MTQQYYFISGLPRSGSTLLSAILKQNPKFHASISDPLHDYARNILTTTHASVGMEEAVPIPKRKELIQGLFETFYKDAPEVCFNTNRAWTASTALLKDLFPYTKIIVCIRDVPWILDSFEQLNSKNPYTIKALFGHQDFPTVYHRVNSLMTLDGGGGYVSGPIACTKQALFSDEKNMLCVVDYDALAKRPKETMETIYKFLGQEWFEHDFENVADSYDEFDESANIKGLHTVKKRVEYKTRKPILPADIWQQQAPQSFWKIDFEHIKKQILWIE
jgi:sulfotransferase